MASISMTAYYDRICGDWQWIWKDPDEDKPTNQLMHRLRKYDAFESEEERLKRMHDEMERAIWA